MHSCPSLAKFRKHVVVVNTGNRKFAKHYAASSLMTLAMNLEFINNVVLLICKVMPILVMRCRVISTASLIMDMVKVMITYRLDSPPI